jgi:multiple sugar transport system substrate-binding protein
MKDSVLKKSGDKLLFILAIAVLAAALVRQGCGGVAGGGGKEKQIKAASGTDIVFTQWWEDDLEKDTLPLLIKEFEDLNKGIKISLIKTTYEDLRRDLFSNSGAASLGDIIALDPLWVPDLGEMGIIESGETGGSQAPLLSFINVLYYNTEILKEAGFSRPPKNRSEFLDYARKVSGREKNRRALAMGGNNSRWIYDDIFPWIWAAGAGLVKDGKPAVNTRPVIESLAFLSAMQKEGLIIHCAEDSEKQDEFISGRAAFMIAPASGIRMLRERMGDEIFSVTSVPVPDNYAGKTFFACASWTTGINSASGRREEARLFMNFLAGKAVLLSEKAAAASTRVSPPEPLYAKVRDIAISGENAADFAGIPWNEPEKILREELSAIFEEKYPPAAAAAVIQKKWEAVPARHKQ